MDERLQELRRQALQGDSLAKQQYILHLIRSGQLDILRELLVDQSFFDLTAINRILSQKALYEGEEGITLSINVIGEDVTIGDKNGDFIYSSPPPPPYEILDHYQPYDYISPLGNYGTIGHSEATNHAEISGHNVIRYFLRQHTTSDGRPYVASPAVEIEDEIDGEPVTRVILGSYTLGELLPMQVRRDLGGIGREKIPNNRGDIFLYVKAEIRADFDWGGPNGLRVAQLQLFYYPGLNQIYWDLIHNIMTLWDEKILDAVEEAVGQVIPEAIKID